MCENGRGAVAVGVKDMGDGGAVLGKEGGDVPAPIVVMCAGTTPTAAAASTAITAVAVVAAVVAVAADNAAIDVCHPAPVIGSCSGVNMLVMTGVVDKLGIMACIRGGGAAGPCTGAGSAGGNGPDAPRVGVV